MTLIGTITTQNSGGYYVHLPALKTEYGPLSYLGEPGDYAPGDRVAVTKVGPDEYLILGVVRP